MLDYTLLRAEPELLQFEGLKYSDEQILEKAKELNIDYKVYEITEKKNERDSK